MPEPLVDRGADLTPLEMRRYSRHIILPGVGIAGQGRLRAAQIAVVGAGGLGSPVLQYLAAAGVGELRVIDADTVDESNLQRQVIHGTPTLGAPKLVSAREAVARLNPDVVVTELAHYIDSGNALDSLQGCNLVIDCTDNFAARYVISDAAAVLGIPHVWGSIYQFEGTVSVFWSRYGLEYRDLFPAAPPLLLAPSCAEGGVVGALCGVIGSVMAMEAVKLISGVGDPLIGRVQVLNALSMRWSEFPLTPDPRRAPTTSVAAAAPVTCAIVTQTPEISVHELNIRLDRRAAGIDDFDLIDVRERNEWDIVHVMGSRLIPKDEVLSGRFTAFDRDREYLVICKSGARSALVTDHLMRAGLDRVCSVAGGVLEWIKHYDSGAVSY